MIVKTVISLVLLTTLAYAMVHKNVHAVVRTGLAVLVLVGLALTWSPSTATTIANFVGVGRGADLLVYMWILISLLVIVMIYVKFLAVNRALTRLARHLALEHPITPTEYNHRHDR